MSTLPVLALADDIVEVLSVGNVLLRAEPGAGKSTGLPLALLRDAGLGGKIVLLEPRRLAARSVPVSYVGTGPDMDRRVHLIRSESGTDFQLRFD